MQDADYTKKELEEIKTKQSAVGWAFKKMITDESDQDLNDLEDRKKLDCIFKRAVTPNGDYFSDAAVK